ncbi:MAG: class I SAM-dependent methyltransferase [Terracidiphilus sp.]|nr:class I SAM-dependent methyltransferase [Terracidiphilus sp.]MDR3776369.1 class I SAM-dependent methyltransferase [Terracidiphilus sp.]
MKPRTPQTDRNQEAPKAAKPAAPSARIPGTPSPAKRAELRAKRSATPKRPAPQKPTAVAKHGKANPPKPDLTKPSQPKLVKPKPIQPTTPRPAPEQNTLGAKIGAKITRRASDRLREGYLWVYASDIESINTGEGEPPALLPVADNRGLLLGTALYSPASQIALRMVSREAIDDAAWLELLADRLRTAIARRKPLLNKDTDACRLCFSEADQLPGVVADKYGDLVILQLLAKGLDSAAVRETCVRVLREELAPKTILERPDPRMRELEGLTAPAPGPLWPTDAEAAVTSSQFRLNGLTFKFDANSGQKTGAFLDQKANYAAVREWAKTLGTTGRALDVCCYQGGFALHLAQVCKQVTGIDSSRASLEVAERNCEANRKKLTAQPDWVEGDAFQILRDWSDAGEIFDTIVLDPPAFAKTQRAVEGALRGYKELNLRALKMLRPGGLLVTCSCSHHVGWAELEASVASAAIDAHRRVRLLERRGASIDHPVVLNLPETEYLKCLVLQVE